VDRLETSGPLAPAGRSTTASGGAPATLAFEAFTHGNTRLAEGKLAEATAAFQRAHELDPERPHATERLVEAERRQQAASPPPVGGS
jgi:hypothetical protein